MRHPFLRTLAGASAVATDPNFENVTLLLHGDGTNGGQNNTFVDGSTNNFTITRNGNTTQGTFSPYGDNWSNYFDGTGDYLTTPDNAAFDMGTGDFTIECWVYIAGNSATNNDGNRFAGLFSTYPGSGTLTNAYALELIGNSTTTGTGLAFYNWQSSTQSSVTVTTTVSQNSWHHIAVARSGTTTKLFLDGSEVASGTLGNQTVNSGNQITVGRLGYVSYLEAFNGYISNLRVLKGTAQYTGSYTVPTAPLTAITNTSLLTCQSNRFRDASTNNFTITRNGDVSVQRFSPFSPTAAYAAGTIGGSGYLDRNGDYLRAPVNTAFNLGADDFTIEFWSYQISRSDYSTPFSFGRVVATTGSTALTITMGSLGGNRFFIGARNSTNTAWLLDESLGAFPPLNVWNHITLGRSGSSWRLWVNGVSQWTKTAAITLANVNDYGCDVGFYLTSDTYFGGYLSDFRVVKGTDVYGVSNTTITVPTAPLTAITNTSLLLNFQNAAILDNAMMAVPETVGNAQIDTTVKKYGTGSLEFDGTGDWLLVPDSPDQRLGTGNFTIECWLYLSATGTARGIVGKGTSTTGWLLSTDSSNKVVFTYASSTITSTGALSGSTWYHLAVVREGTGSNQTKIYIDGTNDGTGTVSTDFTQTNAAYVGANRTGGDPMNGYIDDLRITKGVARYTANFTPPTAAFPDL